MKNSELARRIQQDIFIQEMGAETLVYDTRRHTAYCLNESSSAIWKLADGEHTVAEISAAASVELRTAISEDFVLFALAELRRDGLVEPSAPDVEAGPAISRRAMLRTLGVGGAMLLPAIAMIFAPTAAQAYSGCFDCSVPAKSRRQRLSRTKS